MRAINDGALIPHLKPSGPVDSGKPAGYRFLANLDLCGMNRCNCHGGILFLMITTQSNWRLVVRFSYELQWRFAFSGSRAYDFFGFWSLRSRDNWNSTLNDSRFFSRDLRKRI